ncbi:DUF4974 domain-containing protein [Flavobacteriaceae bacterium TP-CH-4]|uniref:DUF4974 domain-containing protein n=1 Tax=Pelagihabitans pacificus TaxID=2696054 RepID=A0A967E5H8_9FLAO|nr:FecR domain-containing protein [Pelagihabitans pacificus]NHF58605.1 DUF4974 domain-containing protein [Pelagihabitans pacificus]
MAPNIENHIIKFLTKSADANDLDILDKWIQKPRNEEVFKDYVNTYFAIELAMNEPEKEQIKERLLQEIRKEKNLYHRLKRNSFLKYAAMALLFMGVGYFLSQSLFDQSPSVVPKDDDITLQLQDGKMKIVGKDKNTRLVDSEGDLIGVQEGDTLIYKSTAAKNELVFNTLKVPFGKRFAIKLSDGTKVFLNSGSSMRFPVAFVEGHDRTVFLEGEAFFDVTHDKKHPFIVVSEELQVEVLGTTFNLSNYPEEIDTEVVLLEGVVELSTAKDSTDTVLLDPGFKGSYHKLNRGITLKKVNTASYVSWMDGSVVFRNESFGNIILKLERIYNVEIFNSNKELAKETFSATLETNYDTIEEVLGYFNKVHQIEYTIIENKIIIN